ncbi:MAG: ATP-binding protein [Pseudomonadota bacterium]
MTRRADRPPLQTDGCDTWESRSREARTARWRAARGDLRRALAIRAGLPSRLEDVLVRILNISSEGIIVADRDLRILLFSAGAETIFGYSAKEVLGQPIEMLIPPEHRPGHDGHVARFAAGAVLSRRMRGRDEVVGLSKTGETIPVEVGLSKLPTEHGLIFTAIVRDISERRRTEAALTQAAQEAKAANEAKSAFLAAMSHEIRTPLNGVLGMAQAMARDELPDRQRERLEVIRQSGESLIAILNDLLDLSKIEAGKMQLEEVEFDLDQLATSAHATFQALAAQKGLEFDVRIDPRAGGAYRGDPLRLRQILHNLISNAIKFTEVGGVTVELSRAGRSLVMTVRDTGMGVSPEQLERLFDKFEQADISTTRRFGGTGLGLAICRDLAAMMGGRINAASTLGTGATFRVELPLPRVNAKRAIAEAAEPDAAWTPDAPLRVLVAEDNLTNQLVIRTLLNQLGIEPTMVPDGRAAVAAWEQEPWDVILMDVQMPEMDGPTAAAIIRRRELDQGQPRTPILALTANAMEHQANEYRQAGMDGVIAKPIEVGKLFSALAALAAA